MKGWRTILINCAVAVFGVLEATDWSAVVGSDRAGFVITVIAVANMALRAITDTRVGQAS
jgi:hypothetical protein